MQKEKERGKAESERTGQNIDKTKKQDIYLYTHQVDPSAIS